MKLSCESEIQGHARAGLRGSFFANRMVEWSKSMAEVEIPVPKTICRRPNPVDKLGSSARSPTARIGTSGKISAGISGQAMLERRLLSSSCRLRGIQEQIVGASSDSAWIVLAIYNWHSNGLSGLGRRAGRGRQNRSASCRQRTFQRAFRHFELCDGSLGDSLAGNVGGGVESPAKRQKRKDS